MKQGIAVRSIIVWLHAPSDSSHEGEWEREHTASLASSARLSSISSSHMQLRAAEHNLISIGDVQFRVWSHQ